MTFEKKFEHIIEMPAQALEHGVEGAEQIGAAVVSKKPFRTVEEYMETLGPGLTTGAADDDPSGIATYSQTGAQYGFQLLWLSLFSFPLMAVVQEMCARIALATGRGLAANIRLRFSRSLLYAVAALLFVANTFNLGADLGAMAKVTQMLLPHTGYLPLVILFACVILALQIFSTYARYAKVLKYLTMSLLAYAGVAFLAHTDWNAALYHTVMPSLAFTKDQFLLICAILGTTISPYLFFWQPAQEVEEEILRGRTTVHERKHVTASAIKAMREDVWTGMFFSNLMMFFIITACAATLYAHGITNIQTADQAALALRPIAGEAAYLLFAIGVLGTGLLAIPVLAASASYAISETFRWHAGLYHKLKDAYAFYGIIIIAMMVGVGMNMIGMDPIKALIYSAVANGITAPIMLFFIVSIASDSSLMGRHANKRFTTAIGWLTVAIMTVAGLAAIYAMVS